MIKSNNLQSLFAQFNSRLPAFGSGLGFGLGFSATVLSLFLSAAGSLSAQTSECDNIVVFGDSLSDNGNMARLDTLFAEMTSERPYNDGRVSNGLLMVEHLAAELDLEIEPDEEKGLNFALAGARAANRGSAAVRQLRLSKQVDAYESDNSIDDKDLFVITVGMNDVSDTVLSDAETARINITNASDSVNAAVRRLIDLGAIHFIVVNVPNVANLPETTLLAASLDDDENAELIERAKIDSTLFNELLEEKLTATVDSVNDENESTTSDNIDLAIFNLFDLSDRIKENPVDYGFENSEISCFTLNDDSEVVFAEDCDNDDDNINNFAYFDPRHPTNNYHALIFEEFDEQWYNCIVDDDSGSASSSSGSSGSTSSSSSGSGSGSDSNVPLFNRWAAQRMIDQNPHPSAGSASSGSGGNSGSSTGSSSQTVTINGVAGVVRRALPAVPADSVRNNPAFDPNYVSDSGQYSGPLWYPL